VSYLENFDFLFSLEPRQTIAIGGWFKSDSPWLYNLRYL